MNHPMQPTPEQIREWFEEAKSQAKSTNDMNSPAAEVARLAYAAGADAELEASVQWLADDHTPFWGQRLRAARRPKPPSLKQQGRDALAQIMSQQVGPFDGKPFDVLGRAIEALPEEAP